MKKILKNRKAVSAVIGVILMVAITVAIAATVYVYVSGMLKNSEDEQQMITDALENMDWDFILLIPEKYTMSDVDVESVSLDAYDDGWYRLPMELQSTEGPWTEDIWAWFNVDTEKTHIQYR